MTDRAIPAYRYRCGACRSPIPPRRPHIFAGIIVCCFTCAELPATHKVAFPNCHAQDHDDEHDVFGHRLVWTQSSDDAAIIAALNTAERQPA